MGYIGAGPTRFNTADDLTVTGDAEFNGNLTVKGTTVTIDSATVQTVDLGDNDKIRLGDGDDLQIYHDGINSYIHDAGAGGLYFRASSVAFNNAANNETISYAQEDGAVTLYHDGSPKIATTATGVDVTGSVGIGTAPDTSPSTKLHIREDDVVDYKSRAVVQATDQRLVAGSHWQSGVAAYSYLQATNDAETVPNSLSLNPDGGNVGIGTVSPVAALDVVAGTDERLFVTNLSGDSLLSSVNAANTAYNGLAINGSEVKVLTNATERMRIDSGGGVRINATSNVVGGGEYLSVEGGSGSVGVGIAGTNTNPLAIWQKKSGTNTAIIFFSQPGGSSVGSITVGTTSTAYVTSSDYRLKENVVADWDATTRLKQLNPVRFNFISDADTTVDGFLAHEVQEVVPEAIHGTKDGMRDEEYQVSAATGDIYTPAVEATFDDDGVELTAGVDEVIHSADVERPEELAEGQQWRETTAAVMGTRSVPDYQGIDQAKLVPLLVKTIQELEARIAALETA